MLCLFAPTAAERFLHAHLPGAGPWGPDVRTDHVRAACRRPNDDHTDQDYRTVRLLSHFDHTLIDPEPNLFQAQHWDGALYNYAEALCTGMAAAIRALVSAPAPGLDAEGRRRA